MRYNVSIYNMDIMYIMAYYACIFAIRLNKLNPQTEKVKYILWLIQHFFMLFAIRPAEGKVNIFLFASTHNSIWIIKAKV